MPHLHVVVDQKQGLITTRGTWEDLLAKQEAGTLIDVTDDPNARLHIADVKKGTQNGRSTVIIRIDLPDGKTVVAQTTLALLREAVVVFCQNEAR